MGKGLPTDVKSGECEFGICDLVFGVFHMIMRAGCIAQLVRALRLHRRSREFKSLCTHHEVLLTSLADFMAQPFQFDGSLTAH